MKVIIVQAGMWIVQIPHKMVHCNINRDFAAVEHSRKSLFMLTTTQILFNVAVYIYPFFTLFVWMDSCYIFSVGFSCYISGLRMHFPMV